MKTLAPTCLTITVPYPHHRGVEVEKFVVEPDGGSTGEWEFFSNELEKAVLKWSDEGVKRCKLLAVGLGDVQRRGISCRVPFTCQFDLKTGWDRWEEDF